jgi:hypothetical protein
MAYRFATEKEDYSDFASGQVFYSVPGQPAFPVRLASELFQRSLALLGKSEPVSLYDPCCGSAYHLAVLGVLHRAQLASITASDIDPGIARLATRNLALLTPSGLAERRQAIAADWQEFGKASHQAALGSVDRIAEKITNASPLPTHCFVADVTQPGAISAALSQPVDLVIGDLPYGQLSHWHGAARHDEPIWHLLNQLQQVLHQQSVVALATTKGTTVTHENYDRCGRFRHGKRMITFLKRAQ